jgi:hypothetical protein
MKALANFSAMAQKQSNKDLNRKIALFWEGMAALLLQPDMPLAEFAGIASSLHTEGENAIPMAVHRSACHKDEKLFSRGCK